MLLTQAIGLKNHVSIASNKMNITLGSTRMRWLKHDFDVLKQNIKLLKRCSKTKSSSSLQDSPEDEEALEAFKRFHHQINSVYSKAEKTEDLLNEEGKVRLQEARLSIFRGYLVK